MPTYFYQCKKCEHVREDDCSMSKFKQHEPPCTECGAVCKYIYIATVPQVAFKDGPSGSWPSKGNRFQNYRRERDQTMKRRQKDRYGAPKELVPNYQGQVTESWREASNLAIHDKDKDISDRLQTSKTYESRVKKEKKKIVA